MDAVPLLLALLRVARPPMQAWGLAALLRILRGSTANLSACDRYASGFTFQGVRILNLTAVRSVTCE